ncbi:MAG: hypothetical protein ACRD8A_06665 [Candidatus Acidiferrales bacterium]
MPRGVERRSGLRHLHFITCSCYRRLLLLASARLCFNVALGPSAQQPLLPGWKWVFSPLTQQSRSYDFNVWSRQKKNKKLNYMHMNPVKRGLVRNPKNWFWSNYHAYMQIEPVLLSVNRVD